VAHWNTFRSATARRPGSASGRKHRDKIRGRFRCKRGKSGGSQGASALAWMISGRCGMAWAPGTASRSPR
jgi:hypothetical protein